MHIVTAKKGSEKAEMQKLKLKLKQRLVTRVKENILNVQKNAKVTNGNSNADAELHNEVYDDTQIEAMSLELINILSDAYYGNAKCISYSCDKGIFTTDNGMNYHINTGLIPIITILKKLKTVASKYYQDEDLVLAYKKLQLKRENYNRLVGKNFEK